VLFAVIYYETDGVFLLILSAFYLSQEMKFIINLFQFLIC
jgi:hypothetical protein